MVLTRRRKGITGSDQILKENEAAASDAAETKTSDPAPMTLEEHDVDASCQDKGENKEKEEITQEILAEQVQDLKGGEELYCINDGILEDDKIKSVDNEEDEVDEELFNVQIESEEGSESLDNEDELEVESDSEVGEEESEESDELSEEADEESEKGNVESGNVESESSGKEKSEIGNVESELSGKEKENADVVGGKLVEPIVDNAEASLKEVAGTSLKRTRKKLDGARSKKVESGDVDKSKKVDFGDIVKPKPSRELVASGDIVKPKPSRELVAFGDIVKPKPSRELVASGDIVKPKPSRERKFKNRVKTMGMIFMCSSTTKKDCFRYKVLGLPASKRAVVEKIYTGMRLFLYDVELKLLNGIYKAVGPGGYNIEPKAFNSQFPSQVRFTFMEDCLPLEEKKFKKVIKDNYFTNNKFDCLLTSEQVKKLCRLFTANKIVPPRSIGRRNKVESRRIDLRDRLRKQRANEDRRLSVREERPHKRPRKVETSVTVHSTAPSYASERNLAVDEYRRNANLGNHSPRREVILLREDSSRVRRDPHGDGRIHRNYYTDGRQIRSPHRDGRQIRSPHRDGRQIRSPYRDGRQIGSPYKDNRDYHIERSSPYRLPLVRRSPHRDGRDLSAERRDPYRDGRDLAPERRDPYRDGRDLTAERRDPYRDGRDLTAERRDPYRDGRDLVVERRDPYRDGRDLAPERRDPYRDGKVVTYAEFRSPYRNERDEYIYTRDSYSQVDDLLLQRHYRDAPQSETYESHRKVPIPDRQDVYREEPLSGARLSYEKLQTTLVDTRHVPETSRRDPYERLRDLQTTLVETRGVPETSRRDPYDSYRLAYAEPGLSVDSSRSRFDRDFRTVGPTTDLYSTRSRLPEYYSRRALD